MYLICLYLEFCKYNKNSSIMQEELKYFGFFKSPVF